MKNTKMSLCKQRQQETDTDKRYKNGQELSGQTRKKRTGHIK
jgi:hypothetical protein